MIKSDAEKMLEYNKLSRCAQILRCEIELAIHSFFRSRGFLFVNPPILHEAIPNKKSEIYLRVGEKNYALNSSNALYLTAFAAKYEKVYSISPTFRDENESINHLVEFSMLEMEMVGMRFCDLVEFIVEFLTYILNYLVNDKCLAEFNAIIQRLVDLRDGFNPKCYTYNDLLRSVSNGTTCDISNIDPSDIDCLISQYLDFPTIVIDYPIKFASWTACHKDAETAYALNLLLPGTYGELIEGCERITDSRYFSLKFKHAGITNLGWYVESVDQIDKPRCGFGMGIDRLVRWLVGFDMISDTLLFYRK